MSPKEPLLRTNIRVRSAWRLVNLQVPPTPSHRAISTVRSGGGPKRPDREVGRFAHVRILARGLCGREVRGDGRSPRPVQEDGREPDERPKEDRAAWSAATAAP